MHEGAAAASSKGRKGYNCVGHVIFSFFLFSFFFLRDLCLFLVGMLLCAFLPLHMVHTYLS